MAQPHQDLIPLTPIVIHEGIFIMRKNLSIALTFLALVGIAPLLGACNTTAGVGRDISDGGHVITHDANAAK
jgi:predicted small secreted protein